MSHEVNTYQDALDILNEKIKFMGGDRVFTEDELEYPFGESVPLAYRKSLLEINAKDLRGTGAKSNITGEYHIHKDRTYWQLEFQYSTILSNNWSYLSKGNTGMRPCTINMFDKIYFSCEDCEVSWHIPRSDNDKKVLQWLIMWLQEHHCSPDWHETSKFITNLYPSRMTERYKTIHSPNIDHDQ